MKYVVTARWEFAHDDTVNISAKIKELLDYDPMQLPKSIDVYLEPDEDDD